MKEGQGTGKKKDETTSM